MKKLRTDKRRDKIDGVLNSLYSEPYVGYLLADIMYYCKLEGIDFETELAMSQLHFEAEQQS